MALLFNLRDAILILHPLKSVGYTESILSDRITLVSLKATSVCAHPWLTELQVARKIMLANRDVAFIHTLNLPV